MNVMGSWEQLRFPSRGDARGQLVALQELHEIPFEIRRVYYLTKTLSDVVRGLHAHYNLDQILIAISGRCRVRVDNGQQKEEFLLAEDTHGLRVTNLVWREMYDFSPDCVLLVIASQLYDSADYIRDYEVFLRTVRAGQR